MTAVGINYKRLCSSIILTILVTNSSAAFAGEIPTAPLTVGGERANVAAEDSANLLVSTNQSVSKDSAGLLDNGRSRLVLKDLIAWQESSSPALRGTEPDRAGSALSPAEQALKNQYNTLTKEILLRGIELERFSLEYRLEASKQSNLKYLRYGLCQEAGAAGGLAFEAIAAREFRKARRRPLQLNKKALSRGFKGFEITGIVAASSSGFELAANTMRYLRAASHGLDSKSAAAFVLDRSKKLAVLINQQEALIQAHKEHPAYRLALAENAMLKALHDSVLNEFSQFHTEVRGYRTFENLFYALNVATNVTGVVSGYYGNKGLTQPKYNGTSSILLLVNSALTIGSPLLSTAAGIFAAKRAKADFVRKLGYEPHYDHEHLKQLSAELDAAVAQKVQASEEDKYPLLLSRQSGYKQSQADFARQLRAEGRVFRFLTATAVQSDFLAPQIGATLLAQGILGTAAYYKYGKKPLKALNLGYKGAVAATAGTSVAVGATALGIIGDNAYYYYLYKNKKLPKQLIRKRLDSLDEFEKTVNAM